MKTIKAGMITGMVFALATGIASGAYSFPVFEINFNDDTIGDPPSTMSSDDVSLTEVNKHPTSLSVSSLMTVVSEYSVTDGDTMDDQPMQLLYDGPGNDGSPHILMDFRGLEGTTAGNYQVELDMLIRSTTAHHGISIEIENRAGNMIGRVYNNAREDPSDNRFRIDIGGGHTLYVTPVDTYKEGEIFRFGAFFDYDNDQFKALYNGEVIGTLDIPSDHLDGPEDRHVGRVRIRSGLSSSLVLDAAIDNIVAIPEPGTLLMTGAGLLAIAALRKRRR